MHVSDLLYYCTGHITENRVKMTTSFLILIATIAAVAAVPHHKALKRPNHDHIDYYDCSGKTNGNHLHPSDCTRFIACSNGIASDMACPSCNDHDDQCLGEQYLRWNGSSCEWPVTTECLSGDEPDDSACPGISDGGECGKDDCEHCGYCKDKMSHYFRCERTFPSDPKLDITGKWVLEKCDDHLWWNPDLKPKGVDVGGACDEWKNLAQETQDRYKADPSCVIIPKVCEWGQDTGDECTANYWYFDPETMQEREDLSCPTGLLWDAKTETCRSCTNIAACDCPVQEGKE